MKRIRLVSRPALIRLGILFVLLGILLAWCWLTMIRMPLKSYSGPWVPLDATEQTVRNQLRADVQVLAGDIGERNIFLEAKLRAAADYVKGALTNAGYQPQLQTFQVKKVPCENIIVEIPGGARRAEIVIVGAHYDSVSGSPGANDNGSAVAALLVLARRFASAKPECTLRFVAFVNEEPPHFQTEDMGSVVYAQSCRDKNENIVAMLSLETMGYFSDEKGSQKYPFPFGVAYPSTGNFIGFVGDRNSAELVRRCIRTFREQMKFPSEGAALPGWIAGVGWSDHWAFWQAGYPGVMITDTAPFRYPHYHSPKDTPDKLDYDRLSRVTVGIEKVIQELVGH